MKTYQVDVIIKPWEEGGYLAEAPALQGCWVVASTVTEAMEHIVEVVQMHLDIALEDNREVPQGIVEAKTSSIKVKVAVSIPSGSEN